jgi:hypothetical protein
MEEVAEMGLVAVLNFPRDPREPLEQDPPPYLTQEERTSLAEQVRWVLWLLEETPMPVGRQQIRGYLEALESIVRS